MHTDYFGRDHINQIVLPPILNADGTTGNGKLFIGGLNSLLYLQKHNISVVISLCDIDVLRPEVHRALQHPSVTHVAYKIDDSADAESVNKMYTILHQTATIIYEALKHNQNVLVHCYAGISRSGSVVVNYVCAMYGLSFDVGLDYVRRFRPCIHPNDGFARLLRQMYPHTRTFVNE